MKKSVCHWLQRLIVLLVGTVVVCALGGCGNINSTTNTDTDNTSPSTRPPSLPPVADNPTLIMKLSVAARLNGVFTVSGTVLNLSSQPVAGVEIMAVVVRSNNAETPIASEKSTSAADGTFSITLTGLLKNDVVWVGALNAATQTFTFSLDGVVSTLAGKAYTTGESDPDMQDGATTEANFRRPQGVAIDSAGTYLYVTDQDNHAIRRITVADGTVMTFVGASTSITKENKAGDCQGSGTAARLNTPEGIVIDHTNRYLYVADSGNHKIRKIEIATQEMATVAGPDNPNENNCQLAGIYDATDGTGSAIRFYQPKGLAMTSDDAFLYVADTGNHTLRKIDLATTTVTTIAGLAGSSEFTDGTGSNARFTKPTRLAISRDDKILFITDQFNYAIRRMALASGEVTLLLGGTGSFPCEDDGQGKNLGLILPAGIQVDPTDTKLYIADANANKIRVVNIATLDYRLVAGPLNVCTTDGTTGYVDDTLDKARFHNPGDIVLTADGLNLFVADTDNNTIRKIK